MEKLLQCVMPQAVEELLARLEEAGFEAYAVGGCVRDVLLGRTVHDWDICSAASPEEIAGLFSDCKVIPTGIEHGTMTVLYKGDPYEITMFRSEADYDGRRPNTVRHARTVEEDLCRRDFTINAMAYSPSRGIIDLYEGRNDLMMRVLRAVGDPWQRFREDYLRILRALRFSACYGLSIDYATSCAMEDCAEGLAILSGERAWQELSRLIVGPAAGQVLARAKKVLRHLGEDWADFELSANGAQTLNSMEPSLCGRLAYVLDRLGARREGALDKLRCPAEVKNRVRVIWRQSLSVYHAQPCRWLSEFPREHRREDAVSALELSGKAADEAEYLRILQENMPLEARDLAVNGGDLQRLGVANGPEMGELLRELLEQVWAGQLENQREKLEIYIKEKC